MIKIKRGIPLIDQHDKNGILIGPEDGKSCFGKFPLTSRQMVSRENQNIICPRVSFYMFREGGGPTHVGLSRDGS